MKSPIVRTRIFKSVFAKFAFIGAIAAFPFAPSFHAAWAQVAPSLGTAQSFAVLGASTVTNTGPSIVTGNLGVSPGTAVTGFPPGTVVGGTIHAADAVAAQAQSDTTTAYNDLAGQACDTTYGVPTDIGGLTLVPGVYCFSSSAQLTGAVTLDAQGNPNAVWIFKIGSTLTTASGSSVLLINGAQECNVFWQVGSSATIGTSTTFIGNILALTSITLNTDATVSGRTLAQNGAVTMDSNVVTLSVCALPEITLGKAFSPATVSEGNPSTLTITLSNSGTTAASLTSPFTDTLPSGVVISGSGSTTCGGTITTSTSAITLTGGSIPAGGSCTVTVPVTAANGGSYVDSLAVGALQTSNGSNAAPAVATLTVPQPPTAPTLGKDFAPATINAGGSSTLTITLSNADSAAASITSPLTDTLPSGVTVSGSGSDTCGGTVTTTSSTVTLSAGAIPANGSCTVTVPVTAPNGGNYINSLAAGALQTSNGANAAPAVATLTVVAPVIAPTLGKAFGPAIIDAGGTSTLTITLSNADSAAASLTSPFTDTLPSGVAVSGSGSSTCGGTVTTTTSTVTLTGGSIPANGSCTVTVPVTAANGGNYIDSIAAGSLQTSNGINAFPAIATLTVNTPEVAPALGKAFSPATINAGGSSTLTITLSNTNATAASLSAPFTDTLPSGLVVSGSGSNTCGGTVTTSSSTVTLTGGAIPANSSCTVTVPVTAANGGNYIDTLPAGSLQTSNGNNTAPAIATLTVITPVVAPSLGKAFSPATIAAGGTSTLTVTLSNANATAAALTSPFTDTLPSGLVVSGSGSNTCGGTVTTSSSTVTLTGGSIPANGSCTVTVPVTAANGGNYIDSLAVGALQTSSGSNTAPAIATLTVSIPSTVTLGKAFSPATIPSGGASTLTITLSNTNATAASLTSPLTDTLPSGVVVSGSASNTCGGVVSTGASTVTLTGGAIPANGSCTITVPVTVASGGNYIDTLAIGALQTSAGNNAAPAIATLTVLPTPVTIPPTLSKSFCPDKIKKGQASVLTITLSNPNNTIAKLTAPLTDYLPDGLENAGYAKTTCGGKVISKTGSVTLKGGSIPANGSCTVTLYVIGNCKGHFHNELPVGALQTDLGNNIAPADATLTVYCKGKECSSVARH